jgi:hypothetical protein
VIVLEKRSCSVPWGQQECLMGVGGGVQLVWWLDDAEGARMHFRTAHKVLQSSHGEDHPLVSAEGDSNLV